MSAGKRHADGRSKKKPPKAPAVLPVSAKLNSRQEKLRRILIATRGYLDVGATAKKLKVSPSTIWQDRRVIQALSDPGGIEGWDETKEGDAIRQAILFYEGAIDVLLGELQAVADFETEKKAEYKRRRKPGMTRIFSIHNTMNLKLGIFNTISIYRRDLGQFMIQIGLIREAPKRFIFEDADGGGGSTVEDIKEGISEVRKAIATLQERRSELEGKAND